jgi:hypothetical protein
VIEFKSGLNEEDALKNYGLFYRNNEDPQRLLPLNLERRIGYYNLENNKVLKNE